MTSQTENDTVPEMIDHQHLQMWKWLHSRAIRRTNNSDMSASIESSMSNSFDFSADMSRSIDSSSSRILPSPISNFVTPSTSFSSHQYHDIYSLAMPYLQAPPPPYTPSDIHSHIRNASQLLLLHNMATPQSSEEVDIDVVGLTDTTKEVSLNDKEEEEDEDEEEDEKLDQTTTSEESDRISVSTAEDTPLDLTNKKILPSPTSSISICRPTVIIDHHATKSHTTVRRSMSSVSSTNSSTTHDEVAAHFRRSLSGKWPKRAKHEEARNSPLRRRPSFNTHTSMSSLPPISPTPPKASTPTQPIIVSNCSDSSLSVADHFRRALWGKKGMFDLQKK